MHGRSTDYGMSVPYDIASAAAVNFNISNIPKLNNRKTPPSSAVFRAQPLMLLLSLYPVFATHAVARQLMLLNQR